MYLLELMCPLPYLLSSLSWSLDVAEIVVMDAAMILEENVAHLEVGMVSLEVDRVCLIRGPSNVSIAGGITTF